MSAPFTLAGIDHVVLLVDGMDAGDKFLHRGARLHGRQ